MPMPEVTDEGLAVQITGAGSRVHLGRFVTDRESAQILRLDVVAPVLTQAQLRLSPGPEGEPASRQDALLFPGENSIYFEVPAGAIARSSALLLADKPGRYIIKGWEVRQVTTPDASGD